MSQTLECVFNVQDIKDVKDIKLTPYICFRYVMCLLGNTPNEINQRNMNNNKHILNNFGKNFSNSIRNACKFHILLQRSSPTEVFLGIGILKICTKFTGEHPCRSVILIILQSSGGLLLHIDTQLSDSK